MKTRENNFNRSTAIILAVALIAMAILATSCGSGGGGTSSAAPAPAAAAAGLSVSPTTISFGKLAVGTTSAAQTTTLSNGGTSTLTISSVQVTGPNAGDYSATNNCGSSLAPSAQCTVSVIITPSAAGTRTASVVVTDAAPGSPQTVNLSGTGMSAEVALSSDSLNFHRQLQGTEARPNLSP